MDPRTHAHSPEAGPAAPSPPADAESADKADQRLDEELDETFPASDPIPYRHDP